MKLKTDVLLIVIISSFLLACSTENIDQKSSTEKIAGTESPLSETQETPSSAKSSSPEVKDKEAAPIMNVEEPNPVRNTIPGTTPATKRKESNAGITEPSATIELTNYPLPPINQPFQEPAFGTTLRRIGEPHDREVDEIGVINWERHIYSQLQAFNQDSSLILTNRNNEYTVRDLATHEIVYNQIPLFGIPRWNPSQPSEIIYVDEPSSQVLLKKVNVRTGQESTIIDVSQMYPQYVAVDSTPSNEELSHDGKWIALVVDLNEQAPDGAPNQAIISLDLQNKRRGAELKVFGDLYNGACGSYESEDDVPAGEGYDAFMNWAAASPSGKYLVVQWNRPGNERCQGVEIYDIQTGEYWGHVGDSAAHSDIGLDEQGNDVYVSFYQGYIGATKFPGAPANTFNPDPANPYFQVLLDPGYGHTWHLSCQGPAGVCVVTAEPEVNGEPFDGEIYLIYLDSNVELGDNTDAKVRRLAHNRAADTCASKENDGEYTYRAQPQATMSRDGKYVVFASNWGSCDGPNDAIHDYLIELTS